MASVDTAKKADALNKGRAVMLERFARERWDREGRVRVVSDGEVSSSLSNGSSRNGKGAEGRDPESEVNDTQTGDVEAFDKTAGVSLTPSFTEEKEEDKDEEQQGEEKLRVLVQVNT